MNDKYSQQQYQKFLEKKRAKKTHTPLDDEVLRRATEIENDTHQKAQKARQKLQKSSQKQKLTTEILKAQGEKIDNINLKSHDLNTNMRECNRLSKEIKKAGEVFGFSIPLISNIKSYFSKEARMDRKLNRLRKQDASANSEDGMKGYQNSNDEETEDAFGGPKVHTKENDDILGEKKTDDELRAILNELKGMKSETAKQKRIIKSHKGKLGEISRMNDNSEHYMNTTNEELKNL